MEFFRLVLSQFGTSGVLQSKGGHYSGGVAVSDLSAGDVPN